MGMFVSKRRARPRRFDYEPRYYNPERDQKLKQRMRIQSKVKRRRSPAGLVYFIALLLMAVVIYLQMG